MLRVVISLCRLGSAGLVVSALAAAGSPSVVAQTTLPGVVVDAGSIAVPPVRRPPPPKAAPGPAAPAAAGPGTDAPGDGDSASPDGTGVTADRTGTSMTVVTGDQLRRQQIRHAADALRSLPGVTVGRTGGFGGLTQVRIRGAEGNHTLVLIDGIEANPAVTGEFDFSNLGTDDIDRIEVLKGPMSGLYGTGAVGGVINIVTLSGKGPLTLRARAETGAFSTSDLAASVSGGSERAHGALSVARRSTNGFNISPFGNEDDHASITTVAAKAGFIPMDGVALDFTLRNVRRTGGRDGDGGPAGQLATQVDTPSFFATSLFLAGINLRVETLDGRLIHRIYANTTRQTLDDTDVSAFGSFFARNQSRSERFGYASTLRLDMPALLASRHYLTGLVERELEAFNPVTADGIERGRERLSYAFEWRGELADRVFLSASVRHDDNEVFGPFTTWRAASSVWLYRSGGVGIRPHASIGTGVKVPTMFEQFGIIPGFFTPNPALRPETSSGWDAGVELSGLGGRAVLDVTYFNQSLEDRIDTVFAPVWTAINRPGESRREGIEFGARFRPFEAFTIGLSYTYLEATSPDGAREIRRPPHSGRIDLGYLFDGGRGSVSLAAIYNGRMDDTAFRLPFFSPERVTLADYWLLTAGAAYKLQPGLEIYGRVENLLDQSYQEVFGFNTAGIAAYVGMRLTLEDRSGMLGAPSR